MAEAPKRKLSDSGHAGRQRGRLLDLEIVRKLEHGPDERLDPAHLCDHPLVDASHRQLHLGCVGAGAVGRLRHLRVTLKLKFRFGASGRQHDKFAVHGERYGECSAATELDHRVDDSSKVKRRPQLPTLTLNEVLIRSDSYDWPPPEADPRSHARNRTCVSLLGNICAALLNQRSNAIIAPPPTVARIWSNPSRIWPNSGVNLAVSPPDSVPNLADSEPLLAELGRPVSGRFRMIPGGRPLRGLGKRAAPGLSWWVRGTNVGWHR